MESWWVFGLPVFQFCLALCCFTPTAGGTEGRKVAFGSCLSRSLGSRYFPQAIFFIFAPPERCFPYLKQLPSPVRPLSLY